MAAPSKPPKKSNRLGTAPTLESATTTVDNNTTKPANSDLVPLNFKVDGEFRRELKSFAAAHDMSMVDVIKESFALFKAQKGG
jgi:hypothetical protein